MDKSSDMSDDIDQKFNSKIDQIFTTLDIDDKNDVILDKMKLTLPPTTKTKITNNTMIDQLIDADATLINKIKSLNDSTYNDTWFPLLKNLGKLQSYILLKSVPDEIQIDKQEAEIEKKNDDIEEKNQEIEKKNQEIAEKNIKIAEKDKYIEEKEEEIAEKNKIIAEKEKDIEQRDKKLESVNDNKELIDSIINALTHKIEVVNTLLTQNIRIDNAKMTADENHNKYLKYKSKYLHVKKNIY
jgi:uncharacterized protein (DUF3084 family)